MLDRDLAGLYGVPTKVLNQAVKRNAERFPDRFMFSLAESEMNELVTNCDRFEKLKCCLGLKPLSAAKSRISRVTRLASIRFSPR